MNVELGLLYAAVGAVAGLFAGLFGVGGGLIVVPALTFLFTAQHFPDNYVLHTALGTSLANIAFTSISSVIAHHRHHAVRWEIVRRIALPVAIGTMLGALLAARFSTFALTYFFVVFLFYAATQLLLNLRPEPSRTLPKTLGMSLTGSAIGLVSSLVGIGGGTLSVPLMVWCNVKLREAIGTSAAIGFPIAVAGAAGYVISGWTASSALPALSLGFIYLPALVGVVVTSVLFAPLGAKLAHRLPVAQLKKMFALLLYGLAIKMLLSVLQ